MIFIWPVGTHFPTLFNLSIEYSFGIIVVGEVVSDHELDIVSDNEEIVIIKTKIKYHSQELPTYVSNNRAIINMPDIKYPDEHITKIMCKDKYNKEANELFKLISS